MTKKAKTRGKYWPEGIGANYENIVILGGARTPFGDVCKTLGKVSPTDLGILATRAALQKVGLEGDQVNQLVFANVAQSSEDAYYLPRHIGLYSGIPVERPALLVQRICGSGFEVIIQAAEQISLGKADVVVVGGTENMTLNPVAFYGSRLGHGLGQAKFVDTLWQELYDPAPGCSMGETAENLAEKYGISREDADRFAWRSQERYAKAQKAGFFADEIAPVSAVMLETGEGLKPRKVRLPRGVSDFHQDEHPRLTSLEKLSALPTPFRKNGVQTPGNSSGIGDGACALIIAGEEAAERLGKKPLGRLLASASVGVEPSLMGIGPAPACRKLEELSGMSLHDMDFHEVNEAFAAQCLAVQRELDLDPEKLNPNGGSIAIGHPLAATGSRLALTLLNQLKASGSRHGMASACIGGGQGTALLLARD